MRMAVGSSFNVGGVVSVFDTVTSGSLIDAAELDVLVFVDRVGAGNRVVAGVALLNERAYRVELLVIH
jgi:hypothetical protein